VTDVVKGENVLAVRISPLLIPGFRRTVDQGWTRRKRRIMCLDGPTSWRPRLGLDPRVRDRDTGIWQPVTLKATSAVKIGDPQVVTTLPLPDTSRADVEITVPLENVSTEPINGTLKLHSAKPP